MNAKINIKSLVGKQKRKKKDVDSAEDEMNSSLAEVIWGNMTPSSQKKAKLSMESCELPKTMKSRARKELDINFSKPVNIRCEKQSTLEEKIEMFFNRDDISRVCPDRKKVAVNPSDVHKKKPIRYQLGHSKLLHHKFIAEDIDCSYTTFLKKIPYYIKNPSASDWGTGLCATCLNPQLKIERLVAKKELKNPWCIEDLAGDEGYFNNLITALTSVSEKSNTQSGPKFQIHFRRKERRYQYANGKIHHKINKGAP